jgi:hypothetical protein
MPFKARLVSRVEDFHQFHNSNRTIDWRFDSLFAPFFRSVSFLMIRR